MTTLTVDVQNDNILPIIKKVLKAFPGIKVIQRREKKTDPTLMTKEEFFAKIDRSRKQFEEGKYHTMLPGESFDDFLKRIRA